MIKHLFALLLLLKAVSISAIATPPPLPTNFIQKITLDLTVVTPGKTAANGLSATVSNLTLNAFAAIEAMGEATGNRFTANAQWVCVNPIFWITLTNVTKVGGRSVTNVATYGYLAGTPMFEIRDGAKVVDVTAFINVSTINNTYIASYTEPKLGDYTAFKNYRIRTISVTNSALAFSGQGFVESPLVLVTARPGAVVFGNNDDWTSVSGVADNGIINGILQGTISATYEKLE